MTGSRWAGILFALAILSLTPAFVNGDRHACDQGIETHLSSIRRQHHGAIAHDAAPPVRGPPAACTSQRNECRTVPASHDSGFGRRTPRAAVGLSRLMFPVHLYQNP